MRIFPLRPERDRVGQEEIKLLLEAYQVFLSLSFLCLLSLFQSLPGFFVFVLSLSFVFVSKPTSFLSLSFTLSLFLFGSLPGQLFLFCVFFLWGKLLSHEEMSNSNISFLKASQMDCPSSSLFLTVLK